MEAARLFIVRRIIPEDRGHATPCWIWQSTKNEKGYGRTEFAGVKHIRVHRLSYEAYIGSIPDGLHIDHLCCVTSCVNPAHLEAVTPEENARRARRTHCKHGHEYTPETVKVDAKGWRQCLICKAHDHPPRPPRTHCANGHELIPSNVAILPDGGRRCITCRSASEQKQIIRKREKRAAARRISQGWGVSQSGSGPRTHSRTDCHGFALHNETAP